MQQKFGIRSWIAVAIAWGLLAASTPASAADSYGGAVLEKLGHGLFNVVMSPLEVLIQPIAWGIEYERDHGTGTGGFIAGLISAPAPIGVRAVEGVFSLATFPIALPGTQREFQLCRMGCRPFTARERR